MAVARDVSSAALDGPTTAAGMAGAAGAGLAGLLRDSERWTATTGTSCGVGVVGTCAGGVRAMCSLRLRLSCGRCHVGCQSLAEQSLNQRTLEPVALDVGLELSRVLLENRRLLLQQSCHNTGQIHRRVIGHAPSADHSSGCCSWMATVR